MNCKDWKIAYNEAIYDYKKILSEAYIEADLSMITDLETCVLKYHWHRILLEELDNGYRYED